MKYPVAGYRTAEARAFNGPTAPSQAMVEAAEFAEILGKPLHGGEGRTYHSDAELLDALSKPLARAEDAPLSGQFPVTAAGKADVPVLGDLAEAVAGLEGDAAAQVAAEAAADWLSGRLGDAVFAASLIGYAEWCALWVVGVDIPHGEFLHAPGFVKTLDCGGSEDMISDAILVCGTPQTPPRPGTGGFELSFPRHDYSTYDIADPPANPIHNSDTFNATVKAVWTHPTTGDAPTVRMSKPGRRAAPDEPSGYVPAWLDPLKSVPGAAPDRPPSWREAGARQNNPYRDPLYQRVAYNSLRDFLTHLTGITPHAKPPGGFGGGGSTGSWGGKPPTPPPPGRPGLPWHKGQPPIPGVDPDPDRPPWWLLSWGGRGVPPTPPVWAPPGPHVKEQKRQIAAGSKLYKLFTRTVNTVTETADLVEALYHALPEELQTSHSFLGDIDQLYRHWDKVSFSKAIRNLAVNELEDRAIAKLTKATHKNFRPYYQRTGRPVGVFVGPAL